MKLIDNCTHECIICGAETCDCDYIGDNFARAPKDVLIDRYYNGDYSEENKRKLKVWLKVQFDYDV